MNVQKSTPGEIILNGNHYPTVFSLGEVEAIEDGHVEITSGKVFVTKQTPCALTLPVPLQVDNGKDLTVYDTTGQPHEISGVFAGGCTLATMNGDYTAVAFTAFNGIWYANGANLS